MSADRSPQSRREVLPQCFRCDQPTAGVCRFCGRSFCARHGSVSQMMCRPHQFGCLALWVVVVGIGIAVWYFFVR